MSTNLQLLTQIRIAMDTINQTIDNDEHKALLSAADVIINELMLRDNSEYYLGHIDHGAQLLTEGVKLAKETVESHIDPTRLIVDLASDVRVVDINAEIETLNRELASIVSILDENRSTIEKDYLVRVCDWENSFYKHRLEQVSYLEGRAEPITQERLLAYLKNKFPQWIDLKITNFAALDGGFSKKTILFETEDKLNGKQSLVMRAEQPVNLCQYRGSHVTHEYYMIQLMRNCGLPIAEPLWLEEEQKHLGCRFIVSRKAEGRTYGGNLGSEEELSEAQVDSMMSTFIKMHNIKLDHNDPLVQKSHLKEWLPHKNLRETTHYHVTEFLPRLIQLTGIPASPQLQRGLSWLERNIPETDEPPVIVHIDYAFNNLILDDDKITAVLDWESSRLGDPAEDIFWTQFSLGDYMPMPEFLDKYKQGTGREITEYRMAYFKVSKCALVAITCLSALTAISSQACAHINLGVLGLKYMAMFGSQFNELIAAAELAKGR